MYYIYYAVLCLLLISQVFWHPHNNCFVNLGSHFACVLLSRSFHFGTRHGRTLTSTEHRYQHQRVPWLRPHVTALARQLGPGAHVRFWFDWLHFFPCPQRHCCRPEGSQQELRYFLGLLWPEKQVESLRCNVQYLKGLQERNRCSMSGEQILKQRNATDLSLFSNRVQDLAPLFSVHPY